ncbi:MULTISPECIES: LysR family transcriptional regulator [Pantoea]|jgi:DNA-binding transcriptional LysR family regulator|uniref:LysR family transcriptional regulator n=1 Tax=Pantoea brenneri TaxID=472694 RepID=A0ABU9MN55_9GAMM|nr:MULTISPECIES: LysR family transcriptional regulator [Pantoea]KKD31392.1 LysR family transcriptional regulator [Pantoea sp. 3.5.1]MDU4128249.1 LysR family transcriptional regulator [Pantoea sp.]
MNVCDVQLFLTITEAGSLSQAARRLDISAMAVSRRLAGLERELGTRLLQRTTRSVSLTQEGIEFIPYARALVEAEEGAKGLFSPDSKGASGLLRVTAPSGFGRRYLLPLIPELLETNPDLRIDLQFSEDVVDIVGRGIDVAVRIAPLRDSSLIARKIVDNPRVVCASPDYLRQYGVPATLSELTEHNCLRLTNVLQWTFQSSGQSTSLSVDGRFSSGNVESIREFCVQGMGLAQLTLWDVKKELSEGTLQEVTFMDVDAQNLPVWALLPTSRYLPQRVNVFIDALKASLG